MFPRKQRVARKDFPSPNTPAQKASSAYFLATSPRQGAGYAVVVSKKVARLSVTRHKLKRRVVAALKALDLPESLIVFPRAAALELDLAATKAELADLLSKISK